MAKKAPPLARTRLKSSLKPYYYTLTLWKNQENYESSVDLVDEPGTQAVCVCDTYWSPEGDSCVKPKLGEIHFVSGSWSVNVVVHELAHALLHRLRHLLPSPEQVLNCEAENFDSEDEEILAYEIGDWTEFTLGWLNANDPNSIYSNNTFNHNNGA